MLPEPTFTSVIIALRNAVQTGSIRVYVLYSVCY